MKLNEFVSQVLIDIESGLAVAKAKTNKGVYVETKGVTFDVAVTTSTSSEIEGSGKAKIGIIEVLGAGVEAKAAGKTENSEVSRIQFTVYVPPHTEQEEESQTWAVMNSNIQRGKDLSEL